MKHTAASILSLACAASLFTSTGAQAAIHLSSATPPPAVQTNFTESPAWADSFVDSVGADSQFENHRYPPKVTSMLKFSGIRHLRDSPGVSALMQSTFADLGQAGITHSIGEPQGFTSADLKMRLDFFAPYVDYVEPANEADNVPTPNFPQLKLDQINMWNTIHSDPKYSKIAVMGLSFANPVNGQYVAPLDAYENYAQIHNATCDWNPGTDISWVSIAANTAKIRTSTMYKPIVTTETGYNDNPARGCSLSDDIISRYTPRTMAERWLAGEPRTYFTFLVDVPSDIAFGAKGLLFVDGNPKPQFKTLSNMLHVLADKGTAPGPQVVSYAINGATVDVHHLMLARQDGSYDLLLWRELPEWDHFGHHAIAVPELPVTVQIPNNASYVGLFQTNANYSLVRSQLPVGSNKTTATFNVDGAISILHIYGRAASMLKR